MITISFEQAAAYRALRWEFYRLTGRDMPVEIETVLGKLDKKVDDHLVTFSPPFQEYQAKLARSAPTAPQPKEPA